jgi:hypothetical protein
LVAVFFAAVLALLLFGDPLFAVALVDVLLFDDPLFVGTMFLSCVRRP